jgi:hypothetical protein
MIKKLARVSSASLEIKERGVLNFWVHVDYEEGCSQGVGGEFTRVNVTGNALKELYKVLKEHFEGD